MRSFNIIFDGRLKKLLNKKSNYRLFDPNCYFFADGTYHAYIQCDFADGSLVHLIPQMNCKYVTKPLFESVTTKFSDAHVGTLAP